MPFGIVEIITLLLGLSGFQLAQNPKPATSDQALTYAMPDADLVVHVDARAVIGNNYKLLSAMPDQPAVKSSPELAKVVRKAINEVEGVRGLARTMIDIDLTTDVDGGTLFAQMPQNGPPELLIAVRGKFTTKNVDKLGKMFGPPTKVGAGAMIELPPGSPIGAVGVTKDGTLLAGKSQLVKDRLADTWKRPTGGNLAHWATVIDGKPVLAVMATLSPAARKAISDEFRGEKNVVTDLVNRHKLAAYSVFVDGIGWTWVDSNKGGIEQIAQMSEGVMELLRAMQIAPRAFAKIGMAAVESHRGNKHADELLKRKADVWKIVDSYTGDGNFKVAIDKNAAAMRVTARATGKSLSDVVPAAVLLPGAMWLLVGRSADKPPMTTPAAPGKVEPAKPPRLSPNQKAPVPKPAPAPAPRQ